LIHWSPAVAQNTLSGAVSTSLPKLACFAYLVEYFDEINTTPSYACGAASQHQVTSHQRSLLVLHLLYQFIFCAQCASFDATANHSSPQEDLGRKSGQAQASDLAKLVMSNHLAASSANTSTASSPSILPNADKSNIAVRHPEGMLPPPAVAPNGVISHALKSLHEFDAIKRDRAAYDSPYALSNASTAPGSPRM
jgi:hypothetical protein